MNAAAAPHLLCERQLPERLAREQAGLDHLGPAVRELGVGQRLQERGIDHRPRRPVEGTDEVLRVRKVDRRLAADRGVDLPDERRGHRDPVDPAEVRRRGEAGDVARAAPAERDERAAALQPERVPERLDRLDRLRLLARSDLVQRSGARSERQLRVHPVDPGDARVGDDLDRPVAGNELAEPLERAQLDVDPAGREDGAVQVVGPRVRSAIVERPALVVEPTEGCLVLRQRPVAAAGSPPRLPDVDVDEDREGPVAQRRPDLVGRDRAAAERDHRGRARAQRRKRVLGLARAERRLAAGLEDPRDRLLALDLAVDVDERTAEPRRQLLAEGRLAGAHEADQGDVSV